jgi:hypothetical protein
MSVTIQRRQWDKDKRRDIPIRQPGKVPLDPSVAVVLGVSHAQVVLNIISQMT